MDCVDQKCCDQASPRFIRRKISVLHVEDNQVVAQLLDDMLSEQGMAVQSCADGTAAIELLESDERFNVMIVENDLPGLSGLELVLRARSLTHRGKIPIIMLSGDNCEKKPGALVSMLPCANRKASISFPRQSQGY